MFRNILVCGWFLAFSFSVVVQAKTIQKKIEEESKENHEKEVAAFVKNKLKSCEKKWNNGRQIEFTYSESCHQQLHQMMLGETGLDGIEFPPCEVKTWGVKNPKRLFLDCHDDKVPEVISQVFPSTLYKTPLEAIFSDCQMLAYEASDKEPLAKEEKSPKRAYYHHISLAVTPLCYEALMNEHYNLEIDEKIKGCRAGIYYPVFQAFAKTSHSEKEEGTEGKEELGIWCTTKQSVAPFLKKFSPPSTSIKTR